MNKVTACLWILSSLASAAGRGGPGLSPKAKAHLDQGLRYFNAQSYPEAIAEFRAGYALDPDPDFLYAMAQAERLGGDCKSAIDAYRAFVRANPKDEQADLARKNQARCEEELRSATPQLTLALPGDASPEARVTLDGEAVEAGRLSVPLDVSPGRHLVRVEAPRRASAQVEVMLQPGQKQTVAIAPGPILYAPPPVPTASPKLPWLLIGSGAALAAAGGVVLWRAEGIYGGLRSNCGSLCATQRWQGWAIAADVSYALIGVGAAVGVTGVVWRIKPKLSVSAGVGQVVASGEF